MYNKLVCDSFNRTRNTALVNHNTGTLSQVFSLGVIYCGHNKDESSFNLILEHIPGKVVRNASEYFLGWRFNIPRIDTQLKTALFLNNVGGDITFISGDAGDIALISHKLKNIKIDFLTNGTYRVAHKNGTIELYNGTTSNVSSIINKYGQAIKFEYLSENKVSQIYSVGDNSNKIIFHYDTDKVFVAESNGDITRTVVISHHIDFVISTISDINNTEKYTAFTGLWDGFYGYYITSILKFYSHSAREVITINYVNINYSDSEMVKVISRLVRSGFENDEDIEYIYSYSDKNYTGYEPGIPQVHGIDNCIRKQHAYSYTVIENSLGVETSYTFNKFHLLIECVEERSANGIIEKIKKTNHYNLIQGNIFSQPPNYNLVREENTTFECGSSVSYLKSFNYDDFGNILSYSAQKGGEEITYEYYPFDSAEADGCPLDPEGFFVTHIKKITSKKETSTQVKVDVKEFTYLSVMSSPYSSFIMVKDYTRNSLKLREYTYFDHNERNSKTIGLVKNIINFNPSCYDIDGLPTLPILGDIVTTYTYTQVSGSNSKTKVKETTASIADGSKSSYLIIDANYHLNVVEQSDFNGNITKTKYDILDRVIKVDKGNNPETQTSESYSYEFISSGPFKNSHLTTHTEASNRVLMYYYNAYGNLTHVVEVKDEIVFIIKTIEYKFLNVIKVTERDDAGISVSTQYENCLFGISKVTHGDGKIENISYDFSHPNNISIKVLNNNTVLSESRYDMSGKLNSFHRNGEEIENYVYGDFGSEPTTINKPLYDGQIINIFDNFGRLDSIISYNSGRIESTVEYKYQSPQFASSCFVKTRDKNDGTMIQRVRDHDCFGRVKKEGYISDNEDDYSWFKSFSYQNAHDEIPHKTYHSGKLCKEVLLDRVHNKIKEEIIFSDIGKRFKYAYSYDKLGNLISSEEYISEGSDTYALRSKYTYSYDERNNLISSLFSIGNINYILEQQKSSSGRLMMVKNHLGYTQHFTYDTAGRLENKTYQGLGISISACYPPDSGELVSLRLTRTDSIGGVLQQNIIFSHNDHGLITRLQTNVVINTTTVGTVDVTISYDKNGFVTSQSITRLRGEQILEDYEYRGSLPSLSRHEISGKNNNYSYLTPDMVSIISSGPDSSNIAFKATYQEDLLTSFSINNRKTYNFPSDYMGNVLENERNEHLTYDRDNRLILGSSMSAEYHYNPSDRISGIYHNNDLSIDYVYLGEHLLGEVCGTQKSLYITFGKFKIGRIIKSGSNVECELFGIDPHNTVLMVVENDIDSTVAHYYKYTPHGKKTVWC